MGGTGAKHSHLLPSERITTPISKAHRCLVLHRPARLCTVAQSTSPHPTAAAPYANARELPISILSVCLSVYLSVCLSVLGLICLPRLPLVHFSHPRPNLPLESITSFFFRTVVISVVLLQTAKAAHEQLVHHVSQEEHLPSSFIHSFIGSRSHQRKGKREGKEEERAGGRCETQKRPGPTTNRPGFLKPGQTSTAAQHGANLDGRPNPPAPPLPRLLPPSSLLCRPRCRRAAGTPSAGAPSRS